MRAAYADPPYIGMARKWYRDDPRCCEVNHQVLIGYLNHHFDTWALSCKTNSLQILLPMCPAGVRVLAWTKPFASWRKGVRVVYSWEPVIVKLDKERQRQVEHRERDWIQAARVVSKGGVKGAKPQPFIDWLFGVMGLQPGDDFTDVFPGSGAVSRSWAQRNVTLRDVTSQETTL